MSHITIEELWDENDCETCGLTSAVGYRVTIDGEPFGNYLPVARCLKVMWYEQEEVLADILKHLGHTIEFKD